MNELAIDSSVSKVAKLVAILRLHAKCGKKYELKA